MISVQQILHIFQKNPNVPETPYQSFLLLGILYILNGNQELGMKFMNDMSHNKFKLSKSDLIDLINKYPAFDSKTNWTYQYF